MHVSYASVLFDQKKDSLKEALFYSENQSLLYQFIVIFLRLSVDRSMLSVVERDGIRSIDIDRRRCPIDIDCSYKEAQCGD